MKCHTALQNARSSISKYGASCHKPAHCNVDLFKEKNTETEIHTVIFVIGLEF